MGWGLGVVFRSTFRTGWRGLLGLALLIGFAGGAVLTGMEASRRTDSAFTRLEQATGAWDVLVNPDDGTDSDLTFEDIAALPMVEQAGRVEGVFMGPAHIDSFNDLDNSFLVVATDRVATYDIGRPGRLEGRLPDPDAADEAFVSARAAERNGFEVGDTYTGRVLTEEDFARMEQAPSEEEALAFLNSDDAGELVDLEIVGIGAFFDEVVVDEGFSSGSMIVTPAFMEAHDQPSAGFWGAFVDLREGVEPDDFRAAVEAIVPEETIAFQTREAIEDQAERATRPQVAALRVFTAVAALDEPRDRGPGRVATAPAGCDRLPAPPGAGPDPAPALDPRAGPHDGGGRGRRGARRRDRGPGVAHRAGRAGPGRRAEPGDAGGRRRPGGWCRAGGGLGAPAGALARGPVRAHPRAGALAGSGLVVGGGRRSSAARGRRHALRSRPGPDQRPRRARPWSARRRP